MKTFKMVVLIAEDDENDALLIKRAFRSVNERTAIQIVPDGREAIEYFQGTGKYRDRHAFPFPRVLITDLKMPKLDGFELLAWLREHMECNVIPKIVLSASTIPQDVFRAYQLGANAYFQKPNNFEGLVRLIELNLEFWTEAEVPIDDPMKTCD